MSKTNIIQLNEDNRTQLITKSKKGDSYVDQSKGRNRYERRLHSSVASSVREYNSINMDKFFKTDVLDVNVKVRGETDNYIVRMSFSDILKDIRREMERTEVFTLRTISKALIRAFNAGNVYIHCSCPDWKFRFSYWSLVNEISSNPSDEITNNGKEIRNPHDTKGAGCKHTLLVLSNISWLIKVASTINNYINYMSEHRQNLYADFIYPAIYGREYEEPVQTELNPDELANTIDSPEDNGLDVINDYGRTRGQFKKGNQSGIQFASNPNKKQFDLTSLLDGEEESEQ